MANGAILQTRWKFCNNCCGLFFFGGGPPADAGVCPAFPHGHVFINPDSGDYALTLSVGGDFESGVRAGQRNWRFCNKCGSLWFNGGQSHGVCPAGGSHTSVGSGDYALFNQGADFAEDIALQRNWRFCSDCFVLWFAGKDFPGVCSAGGGHNVSGSGDYALMTDIDNVFN
jgi:hypothetical protein